MEIAIGKYLLKMSGAIYKTCKVEVKRATSDGSEKCVKIIDKQTNEQEQQIIEREQKIVEILKNINHPNIIRYFDVHDQDNKLYIFMEMGDQSLAKHIEKRDYSFSEREIFDFIFQVSSGYLKLIELEIFHRDIKGENIVIKFENDNRPIYKIIDFGRSNTLDLKGLIQRMQTPIQSSLNTSPESKTGHYDERSDLYSLGLVVLKMYNYLITQSYGAKKLLDKIVEEDQDLRFFSKPQEIPESVWNILAKILCPIEKRITWFDLNKFASFKLNFKDDSPQIKTNYLNQSPGQSIKKQPQVLSKIIPPQDQFKQHNYCTQPSPAKSFIPLISEKNQQFPLNNKILPPKQIIKETAPELKKHFQFNQNQDNKQIIFNAQQQNQFKQNIPSPNKPVQTFQPDFQKIQKNGQSIQQNNVNVQGFDGNFQNFHKINQDQIKHPLQKFQLPDQHQMAKSPPPLKQSLQNNQGFQPNFQFQHLPKPSLPNNNTFQQKQFTPQKPLPQFNQFPPNKPFPQQNQ